MFFLIQQRIRLFNIISPPGSADNGNDSLSEEDVARGKRVSSCSRYLTLSPGTGHCHTRQGEQRLVACQVLTLAPADSFHSLDRPGLFQENPVHGLCPHHQHGDTEPEQEFQSLTILTFLQVRAN